MAEMPKLPRTAAEVDMGEWRRQIQLYLAAQKAEIVEALEEKKRVGNQKMQAAEGQLTVAKQQYKAKEDEKAALLQKLDDLKSKRGIVMEQRQQQLKETLENEKSKLAVAQTRLQVLKQELEKYEAEVKIKQEQNKDRLHAMKTIRQIYTKYTQMGLEIIDEENKIVSLKFVFVDDDFKVKQYDIQIKELTRKLKYQIIDPKKEVLQVLDNNHIITNIGKALFDIRNMLHENTHLGEFRP